MATTLPELNYTTPEEFVNYYYEKLKADLNVYDIQISKVGFVGFLLNLLGYTHFDLKQYYDSLFKEAFVGTSQTEESQYLHASIYGYVPSFATSATATGTIEFDMINWLPRRQSGVVRREVIVGYDNSSGVFVPLSFTFKIEDIEFSIDAIYTFVEVEKDGSYYYYTNILTRDGTKINLPSSSSTIVAPLYSTTQYAQKEVLFQLKSYNFGSFQTYYFSVDPGYYLSDLEVYVTESGSTTEEKYDIKYTKYLEGGNDKSVFLRKVTSADYVLEFGSGIRGKWISGASIRLIIKTTRGAAGNLIDKSQMKIPLSGTVLVFDYIRTSGGSLASAGSNPMVLQQPLVDFDYSENGADPLSGEDLRDAIVNYIQTRDNMISQRDFYNIASDYFNDFKFLLKKINIFDNTFYLCRSFRDRDQTILYTTNHTEQVLDFNATLAPTFSIAASASSTGSGTLVSGTYGYFVVAVDEWGQTVPSTVVTVVVDNMAGDDSVTITFDAIPYAVSYRVYGRNETFRDQYWEIIENGSPNYTYVDNGIDGVPSVEPITYSLRELYYYPTFTIGGEDFVSPFLYRGNTRMNYYDGYLMRDLSRLEFSDMRPDVSILGSGLEVPVIYLNLEYDEPRTSQVLISNSTPAIITWNDHGLEYDTPIVFSTDGELPAGIIAGTTYYVMRQGYSANSFQISTTPRSNIAVNTSSPGSGTHVATTRGRTLIRVRSYQTISDFVFTLSIYGEELEITNEEMTCYPLTNNYFEYVYSNSETCGILDGKLRAEVKGGKSDSVLTFYHENFVITPASNTLLIKFNDASEGYIDPFTTVTLTVGTVTADTLALDINTAVGMNVAAGYTDDGGYRRIRITPPPGVVQNIFIGESSTCLNALGLTGNDSAPAVLNGPLTSLNFTAYTDDFYQLVDISDQLRLFRYVVGDASYVINIPVIQRSIFESDPNYYLDKINSFLTTVSFSENRMITDNVQCRFLNSYVIESPFIESVFLQSGQIFSSVDYNWLESVLDTRNTPPTVPVTGSRHRVGTSPTVGSAFVGHANEIATWTGSAWSFYSPETDDFVLDENTNIYWRWDGTDWVNIPSITLPLKIRVMCKADKGYIQRNNIDIASEVENLTLAIADYLQKDFTGADVVFYNSLITEFVHSGRDFIKSVRVYVTDSSTPPNEMDNGIEVRSEKDIMSGLKDKFDIVRFVPPIIYWDINNIDVNVYIE